MISILPIQCRTGCKEQVNYEHFPFSDGFIYLLPKNLDGTIHDCKNLRIPPRIHHVKSHVPDSGKIIEFEVKIETWSEDEKKFQDLQDKEHEQKDNGISDKEWIDLFETTPNQYNYEYFDLTTNKESNSIIKSKNNKNDIDIDLLKKKLLNLQMRCILFPTPFHSDPNNEGNYDLVLLSEVYEKIENYQCAITARLIQEKISQDQTNKILELIEKQKNPKYKNKEIKIDINISAIDLRDKYYRKVEKSIKKFIRNKYSSIKELEKDFPEQFEIANSHRTKTSEHIISENNDVIEFLSFGACVKILKYNKKNREKPEWNIIDDDIITYAYFVLDRRNEMDHFTDADIEKAIPIKTRAVGYIFSKNIIDFFEKIQFA